HACHFVRHAEQTAQRWYKRYHQGVKQYDQSNSRGYFFLLSVGCAFVGGNRSSNTDGNTTSNEYPLCKPDAQQMTSPSCPKERERYGDQHNRQDAKTKVQNRR